MVWEPEHSPLYRSVEEFNSSAPEQGRAETPAPEERHAPPPPCPPPQCAPPPKPAGQAGFLQRLTGDRDFLLIAALILLLWHEKADIKLIAALAYILLA